MIKKTISALAIAVVMTGCSTITIHPETTQKRASTPSFEETKKFYLGGLIGDERVNVAEVCGDKSVKQMQSQQTFEDGLLGFITLGIYAPHTVKVWCE